MRTPDPHDQVRALLDGHARWQASSGREGEEAYFKGMFVEGYDFGGLDLEGVVFEDSVFVDCSFAGTDLSGCAFTDTQLIRADLRGADLVKARFSGCRAPRARFDGALLNRVEFDGTDLAGSSFRGADLSGADFEGCDLEGAVVEGAVNADVLPREAERAGAVVVGTPAPFGTPGPRFGDPLPEPTPIRPRARPRDVPGFGGVVLGTWDSPPAPGVRPEDVAAFQEVARERGLVLVVRDASVGLRVRADLPGFRARPPEVPGAPRDASPGLGLVAAGPDAALPEGIQRGEDGVLRDADGNAFFEGYELLGVFDAGDGAWAFEPAVREDLNRLLGAPLVQLDPYEAAAFGGRWPPGLTPAAAATAFLPEDEPVRLESADAIEVFYRQQRLPWERIYPSPE